MLAGELRVALERCREAPHTDALREARHGGQTRDERAVHEHDPDGPPPAHAQRLELLGRDMRGLAPAAQRERRLRDWRHALEAPLLLLRRAEAELGETRD